MKITFNNKTNLNTQPDIARENKITDDDMNEIKAVVNNNDDNVGDLSNLTTTTKTDLVSAINELNIYSTTEQRIGTWIDGKPLYRKVLQIDNPLNFSNPYDIDISSLNVDWLEIENFQFEYTVNNYKYSFQNSGYTSSTDFIRIFRRDNSIRISSGTTQTGATNKKLTFILKYTKTTD